MVQTDRRGVVLFKELFDPPLTFEEQFEKRSDKLAAGLVYRRMDLVKPPHSGQSTLHFIRRSKLGWFLTSDSVFQGGLQFGLNYRRKT